MKHVSKFLLLCGLVLLTAIPSLAQKKQPEPHIGYAYPAGGKSGTTFQVTLGGKNLWGVKKIHVTGEGVSAEFVEQIPNYKRKLQEHIRVLQREKDPSAWSKKQKKLERRLGPPPEHEIFIRLEEMPFDEFKKVADKFNSKERVQRNQELDQLAVIEVTIDPQAEPGLRELRLVTGIGLTNPIRFMVNSLPEVFEDEPNDQWAPEDSCSIPPFILNGQVMPGDEDTYSFIAEKGQDLVIHVRARELVPYLADAVPGWFQAVITIHDDKGMEVAYADDFLFSPDPTLLFEVPESGKYHLSIRDSIYRGREDFVYRISVGEIPFVTGIFPLGGKLGKATNVSAIGWNLPDGKLPLETTPKGRPVRTTHLQAAGTLSNPIHYAVDALSESFERENNNSFETAQKLKTPAIMNGRVDFNGDLDVYEFTASKGDSLTAEIVARRLYSPVDSLLRIFDGEGNVLAWNDDAPKSGNLTDRTGLLTHNADSIVSFEIPADGTYYIQVSDTQNNGGQTYAYRLSVEDPQPDFEIYLTPSGIGAVAGSGAELTAHAIRKNGFEGPIEIRLIQPNKGFKLNGNTIPAGTDRVHMVLKVPFKGGMISKLEFNGIAHINGKRRIKRAIPADDITQAFITHHLVETEQLTVSIAWRGQRPPDVQLAHNEALEIRAGESVTVDLEPAGKPINWDKLTFELAEAPEGMSLESFQQESGLSMKFLANDEIEPGQTGNLIVGVFTEVTPKLKKDGTQPPPRKVSLGVLPAIPYRTR